MPPDRQSLIKHDVGHLIVGATGAGHGYQHGHYSFGAAGILMLWVVDATDEILNSVRYGQRVNVYGGALWLWAFACSSRARRRKCIQRIAGAVECNQLGWAGHAASIALLLVRQIGRAR